MAIAEDGLIRRIQEHTFRSLPGASLDSTNLHVDVEIREAGKPIGPEFDKIVADRPTIVVFVDEEPRANFAHRCRYRLYDAKSAELYRDTPARFPPFVRKVPDTLRGFHLPVTVRINPDIFHVKPVFRCPIILPDGARYAILFSGMSNKRHINDIEFLYRTLVDRYAFPKKNIYVLTYDGTLDTQDGVQATWPGDGTAYRMKITGQGNQAGFESALDDVKGKLKKDDLLLIHTNNHGGNNGPGQSFLCTYPNWGSYFASDFGNKLAQLPKYRALIVMMEQCNSGGFNSYVISKSTAAATSIASAAIETQSSYVTADGNWDPFARDWIAAQAGHLPNGGVLASNPDTNSDGRIQAKEAYNYALAVQDPRDSPNYNESSTAGGDIVLGQLYLIWWIWCPFLIKLLEPHYLRLPPEEFYAILNDRFSTQFRELVATAARESDVTTKNVEAKLKPLVESFFKK
jgi:Peptidase C13 family